MEYMRIRIVYIILLGFFILGIVGCHTTEERLTNVGESIHNIVLDGDGVN